MLHQRTFCVFKGKRKLKLLITCENFIFLRFNSFYFALWIIVLYDRLPFKPVNCIFKPSRKRKKTKITYKRKCTELKVLFSLYGMFFQPCDGNTAEPPHGKTKMACALSEDSDQAGHPPSLIRVFAVRMKKARSLASHWTHSEDSDQSGRMPRLIWVFDERTCHFVRFVMRRLNYFCFTLGILTHWFLYIFLTESHRSVEASSTKQTNTPRLSTSWPPRRESHRSVEG